jgi:hypothetical protein
MLSSFLSFIGGFGDLPVAPSCGAT